MFTIKKAKITDLQTILEIYYYNTSKSFPREYPTLQPTKSPQYESHLAEYINNKSKCIYLICMNDIVFGYSTMEPDTNILKCAFLSNLYFNFSKLIFEPEFSEKDIKSIKTGILLFFMNKAKQNNYTKLSIISDNHNNIHDICKSYNAKTIDFQGLNYSYTEKFLFDPII